MVNDLGCRLRSAGLGQPRPLERGTRCAPRERWGAGKRAERFHAASSWRVIRAVLTTRGASVRLACVAHTHPLSPRWRAQREYERRPFSGSRKGASAGQGRRCVGSLTVDRPRSSLVGERQQDCSCSAGQDQRGCSGCSAFRSASSSDERLASSALTQNSAGPTT